MGYNEECISIECNLQFRIIQLICLQYFSVWKCDIVACLWLAYMHTNLAQESIIIKISNKHRSNSIWLLGQHPQTCECMLCVLIAWYIIHTAEGQLFLPSTFRVAFGYTWSEQFISCIAFIGGLINSQFARYGFHFCIRWYSRLSTY